jgi:hypothetical protein
MCRGNQVFAQAVAVMAGLGPATTSCCVDNEGVDARHKAGHDGKKDSRIFR